jgi:hypothetical protein
MMPNKHRRLIFSDEANLCNTQIYKAPQPVSTVTPSKPLGLAWLACSVNDEKKKNKQALSRADCNGTPRSIRLRLQQHNLRHLHRAVLVTIAADVLEKDKLAARLSAALREFAPAEQPTGTSATDTARTAAETVA